MVRLIVNSGIRCRCGHCKTLAPVWEEVAKELEGSVNVAKIDVMENRALGTRFEIKGERFVLDSLLVLFLMFCSSGFPTLKLISKGQVYSYKGRRSKDELVEFARGGYAISEPETVPGELGWFGEITQVYNHAYKQAAKDLKRGNYFTADVVLAIMPAAFLIIILLICLIPSPDPRAYADSQAPSIPNKSESAGQSRNAAPATSAEDTSKKSD
jgi:thiol-disulfide isomerase/thioredoxin